MLDAIMSTTVKKQFARAKKAWEDSERKPKFSDDFIDFVSQVILQFHHILLD